MKKISIALIFFVVCFFAVQKGYAAGDTKVATQTVNLTVKGSALLAVDGGAVSLSLGGASNAGDAAGKGINSSTRMRLTSLVDADETRSVSAQITTLTTAGATPRVLDDMSDSNTKLTVAAGTPGSNSSGGSSNWGTLGSVVLSKTSASPLITGIKTFWTGSLAGDGYPLTYTYEKDGANPLSVSMVVTYTISTTTSDGI